MATTFNSLAQVLCTAVIGWLMVKWMIAKRVAREITSVMNCNTLSLVLTLVVHQFVSTPGRHHSPPPIPFSRNYPGLNLSLQRPDGVVFCQFLTYVAFLATFSRSLILKTVYKKYGSTCLASTTFWDAQPMYWVADADAARAITSDRFTFAKDLEAVRAPLVP